MQPGLLRTKENGDYSVGCLVVLRNRVMYPCTQDLWFDICEACVQIIEILYERIICMDTLAYVYIFISSRICIYCPWILVYADILLVNYKFG